MLVRGGGAYGKTASAWPYRFSVKLLLGIYQEISAPPVSWYRSPQPNDRAQRVSERGSGISPDPASSPDAGKPHFTPAT